MPQAPTPFEQFEQRRVRKAARRRTAIWSTAGAVLVLGLVSVLALVTQGPAQRFEPGSTATMAAISQSDASAASALVDMGQFDVTAELEDHIALLDAELSAARVHALPAEQLRRLESTRAQLSASLQQVSYAHSLLSL